MPNRPRILGVDDNPRNLTILKKCIGDEFAFVSAASGEEALEIAPRVRPALVLLDVMMPGIDGYETCRRVRADPLLASQTKIIMVSAKASAAERLQGYAAGADDYLVKPFDADEMMAKVRVYVRLKSVEEVDTLKTNLLTLLGHETRTPLTLILSPLALLLEDPGLSPKQRELVGMIDLGARRLQNLIDRVSFLSELKMGAVPLRMEAADLGSIAKAAVARMAETAGSAGVSIELDAEGPSPVFGDARHLGSVIEALLDNAIRFSPRGERVRVRAGAEGPLSFLVVQDRGPGVPSEQRGQLFQEYAVSDLDHHSKGHGLSLATGRHLAEQHGGTLTLDTEGPRAGGAAFRLQLPAAAAAAGAPPAAVA